MRALNSVATPLHLKPLGCYFHIANLALTKWGEKMQQSGFYNFFIYGQNRKHSDAFLDC